MSRDRWLAEVDRILREIYCIGYVDAGWDDEVIDRYFGYGLPPKDFVLWYGEKYELLEFERFRPIGF